MLSSDFEKQVQQKMEELRFSPPDAVWEKVEAALPKRNRRRVVIYWLLLAMLAGGGIWYFTANQKPAANKPSAVLADHGANAKTLSGTEQDKVAAKDVVLQYTNKTDNTPGNELAEAGMRDKGKKPQANTVHRSTAAGVTVTTGSKKTGAATVAKSISDGAGFLNAGKPQSAAAKSNEAPAIDVPDFVRKHGAENDFIKAELRAGQTENSKTNANNHEAANDLNSKVAGGTKNEGIEINKAFNADSTPGNNITVLPAVAKATKAKKALKKWEFGIYADAGISNVKKGLFNNLLYVSSPVLSNGGSIGVGNVNGGMVFGSGNSPSPAFAYSAGIYAERNLSKKWSFYTGIYYTYMSNKLQVGSKVDSAITASFDNRLVESSNYYNAGGNTEYNNRYHLLQLPLLIKFKPVAKLPVYLELGPSLGYVIQTTALQYSFLSSAYVTDKSLFNKLLVSATGGAGFKLAQKTKLPLNIGYRFNYSLSSITKKDYESQHLISSLLYLNIRLNK